jgi:hypothetical protein
MPIEAQRTYNQQAQKEHNKSTKRFLKKVIVTKNET